MPGSKVHYLFCIDFCKLFGQDHQRPNQESWEAMSLDEQQAFVTVMSAPPLVAPQLVDADAAPEELGVTISDDGTVTPLPGNDIVMDSEGGAVVVPDYPEGGNTPIVSDDQLPVTENIVASEPFAPQGSVEGDLGSVPLV